MPERVTVYDIDGLPGRVAPGQRGWLYWDLGKLLDVRIQIREVLGRYQVSAVLVQACDADEGVTGRDLRSLPIGKLESWLSSEPLRLAVASAWRDPEAMDFRPEATKAFAGFDSMEAPVPIQMDRSDVSALRLDVPNVRKRDDAFYAEVARVFDLASAMSPRPAIEIAEANGVPVSTVHRWLKEHRRRANQASQIGREQGP